MVIKKMIKSMPVVHKGIVSICKYAKKVSLSINVRLLMIKIKYINRHDRNKAFWIITPVHGNLGDQAIAKAEQIMLKKCEVAYLEITGNLMFELMKRNQLNLFNGNPIIVHGGGYLGTLWFNDEILVRNILKANPDSQILFLPNTVFFENDQSGREEQKISQKIYNSHKYVKFYAREKRSFELLKEMGMSAGLAPDMVMFLKEDGTTVKRSGCMLLLRSDCEKTRTDETDTQIRNFISAYFKYNATWSDTVVPREISIKRRNTELESFFYKLRSFELIITDRLHGMILAAITGTPCIVLNSKSPKVLGCYEWLKHLDYIRVCEKPSMIDKVYEELPKENQVYHNELLFRHYRGLMNDIRNIIK